MDGEHHGDFVSGEPIDRPPARERSFAREKVRRAPRVHLGDHAGGRVAPAAGPPSRAFHYASERCVLLGQIADRLPRTVACRLTAGARRMPVVAIRLSTLAGASVHVSPTLTGEALYLDHRDFSALEGGAVVPDLADVIAAIR